MPAHRACPECDSLDSSHPQTHAAQIGGCVDTAMLPVLHALWTAGCRTTFSCEDQDGRAQVTFPDAGSLERAVMNLRAAALHGGDRLLRQRIEMLETVYDITAGGVVETHQDEDDLWAVKVWPQLGWRVAPDVTQGTKLPGDGVLFYQLNWPPSDLPLVTRLLAGRPPES